MVTFKGATRFYSRNSTGKYRLDVHEIRSAFALSESLPEKLSRFRDGRLASIVANETPVSLPDGGRIVLHCVPITAMNPTSSINLSEMDNPLSPVLRPISPGGGWSSRFNFDGFLTYGSNRNYTQLFRSGAIEAVEANALNMKEWRRFTGREGPDFIAFGELQNNLIEAVSSYTQLQKRVGLEPPIFILVSLLGVRNYRVTTGSTTFSPDVIDRDALVLPDVLLNDFAEAPAATLQSESLLKPIFDAIAQAAGLAGSPNYDANGNRKARR